MVGHTTKSDALTARFTVNGNVGTCNQCGETFTSGGGAKPNWTQKFERTLPLCAFDWQNPAGAACQLVQPGQPNPNTGAIQCLLVGVKGEGPAIEEARSLGFQGDSRPILQSVARDVATSPHAAQHRTSALKAFVCERTRVAIQGPVGEQSLGREWDGAVP